MPTNTPLDDKPPSSDPVIHWQIGFSVRLSVQNRLHRATASTTSHVKTWIAIQYLVYGYDIRSINAATLTASLQVP